MSTHKYIDRICCVVIALALILTVAFMNGSALGIQAPDSVIGYEDRLFDTSAVHTIEIVMDDWEGFLESCTDEEYVLCDLVIDGESCRNVAIRAKGNTSLTQVASYGNDRYSFKIEFDHYDSSITYHGLDKLCLNNMIQDNTYMKDYLTYQMMGAFGVDAPLCSYVYLTVNGEDWGLYLAVEGVEDAFLERNYGGESGELYKPDSMSMGGGRGNGGAFDMEEWMEDRETDGTEDTLDPETFFQEMGDMGFSDTDGGLPEPPQGGAFDGGFPESGDSSGETAAEEAPELPAGELSPDGRQDSAAAGGRPFGGGMGGMMGSDDVSLIYTDDDYESYSNIFDSAKTDITDADKDRLIESLRQLNAGENIESVVDVDEVIRYFVVHNFVCNFDSYTGSMIHNYYLYEEDGRLSMIPWDYNLAFGGFQGGGDATSMVNYPIDTPVSGGTVDSRPMLAWIFASEEYTALYHQYFDEFLTTYFESGCFQQLMAETEALIAPYVERDPTKFCTYEEFETGVDTLEQFCLLRAESIRGQLEGTIPATSDGQTEDSSSLVDASGIIISDMGTMNNGGMGGMGRGGGLDRGQTGGSFEPSAEAPAADAARTGENTAEEAPAAGEGTASDGEERRTVGGQILPEAPVIAEETASADDRDGASASARFPAEQAEEETTGSQGNAASSAEAPPSGDMTRADAPRDRDSGQAAMAGTAGDSAIPLLAASGLVLLTGLLIAALYRKRA